MKNYDEATCLRALKKKRSINIKQKTIIVEKDNTEVGHGSWAKIDYLCHYCGYVYMILSSTGKIKQSKLDDDEDKENISFSMAKSVKLAMRN